MVAVGSKSIPEKQSISVGVSKNSENNLENELFGDIFASTTLDTKKDSLSTDYMETDEVEIAKQEHQVQTNSISNESSPIKSNNIDFNQNVDENIDLPKLDFNLNDILKENVSNNEEQSSNLDEIDFETGVSAELKVSKDNYSIENDVSVIQAGYLSYKLNSKLNKNADKETDPQTENNASELENNLYKNSLHLNQFVRKEDFKTIDHDSEETNEYFNPKTHSNKSSLDVNNLLKNDSDKVNKNNLTEEAIFVKSVNKEKDQNYDDHLDNIKINKEDYSKLNKNDKLINNKFDNIKNDMQNNVDSNTSKFFETKYISSANTYIPQSKNNILNNQTNLTNSSFELSNLNISNNFSGGSSNQQSGTQSQNSINNFQMLNDIKENLDMSDKRWSSNLVSRLNKAHSSNINEIELVLTPKNLGRMKIKISLSDKTAFVKITTDSAAASSLIQDEQDKLNEMLKEVGLELEDFSSNQSFQQKSDDGKNQANKNSGKTLVDLKRNDESEEKQFFKDESLLNIKV